MIKIWHVSQLYGCIVIDGTKGVKTYYNMTLFDAMAYYMKRR